MSNKYPLALPDTTPMPTSHFTAPVGMIEDETRRNTKTGIAQLRNDLGIDRHEEIPGREEKVIEG